MFWPMARQLDRGIDKIGITTTVSMRGQNMKIEQKHTNSWEWLQYSSQSGYFQKTRLENKGSNPVIGNFH